MLPTQTTNSSAGLQGAGSAQGSTPRLQPVRPTQGLQPQTGTPDSFLTDNSSILFSATSRALKVEVALGQSTALSTTPLAAPPAKSTSFSGGIFLVFALIFGVLAAVTIIYYRRQRLGK